jgi:putative copper resistance protein D
MELQIAQNAVNALLNVSIALAIGCCLSATWLAGAASPWALRSARRLHALAPLALAFALVCELAVLWLQAASMAEVALLQAGPAILTTLTASHFGSAWIGGMAALVIASWATLLRRHAAPYAVLVALALFLYSRSMLSHAAADGDISVRVAVDWLHRILISVWVGEVFVAGLFTLRGATGAVPAQGLEQARYIESLSTSATVALFGIILSGLYSSWQGLGGLAHLFDNTYAKVLLVKLLLVGGAALLGGVNRLLVMPSLVEALRRDSVHSELAGRRFVLVLQVEAVVLAGALLAAAVLSSTSPPSAL